MYMYVNDGYQGSSQVKRVAGGGQGRQQTVDFTADKRAVINPMLGTYGGKDTPAHTRSLGCKVLAQSSPSHHRNHQFAPGAYNAVNAWLAVSDIAGQYIR